MHDEYLWLEEIEGRDAIAWASKASDRTLVRLAGDPRHEPMEKAALAGFSAPDRIPFPRFIDGRIFNFWQDETHVRGIWRSTSLEEYARDEPAWKTVLDIDALADEEGADWFFRGAVSPGIDEKRCLLLLSRGGGDAVEIREFCLETGEFVDGGFFVPEGKSRVCWLDHDTILVAADAGPGSRTEAGYPRTVRLWRRGTCLDDAPEVLSVDRKDALIDIRSIHRDDGEYTFIVRVPDFFCSEVYQWRADSGPVLVPLPRDADFQGVFQGLALAILRTAWRADGKEYAAGSLIAIELEGSIRQQKAVGVTQVYAPSDREAVREIVAARDAIFVSVLDNINGRLLECRPSGNQAWSTRRVQLPDKGTIRMVDCDVDRDLLMFEFETFLSPPGLFLLDQGANPQTIKSGPVKYDARDYQVEQKEATSRDGTSIPYYVLSRSDIEYDGRNPVLMFAYGGFEVSLTPEYPGPLVLEWLKAGGVYVVANLRGGGEFGPRWHEAALLGNREKAFEDFIAVAEDLMATGLTTPERLAIRGRSNGGLLVSVALTRRPDLFRAVICAVPLIDMLRYHKLLAGAIWTAEYGNPDIPEEAAVIRKYSPYQKVSAQEHYPEVFFWTNRKDDRVHPGHARKMAAKMLDQGHRILYFESEQGGHAGGGDPVALARITAMELVFLMQTVMDVTDPKVVG